ncbi:MAG: OB-fold nucleic acid binding domain-containing protein, partial [Candidatus Levybacteria bacterium]|nr:OB-fold nucleic acid binding domain-containing protein [Candidatus Levybacteria bacterium]
DFSTNEKLAFEKEFLGLYLTSHPQLSNLSHVKTLISHELEHLLEEKEGTKVKIGGIIESLRRIFTKKNNSEMAFLLIANEKGQSVECVVFPRVFEQYKSLLIKDSVIIVEGHLDTKNDRPSIIAEKILQVNHHY